MVERAGSLPNDEFALYNEGDFRLRVLTSGGFPPTASPHYDRTCLRTSYDCTPEAPTAER